MILIIVMHMVFTPKYHGGILIRRHAHTAQQSRHYCIGFFLFLDFQIEMNSLITHIFEHCIVFKYKFKPVMALSEITQDGFCQSLQMAISLKQYPAVQRNV